MSIYRLPFGNDPAWTGSNLNWDSGGHGGSQAYAFDITHASGGEVRAAREGFVLATISDRTCNTRYAKPGDLCYGLPATFGQGNLVLIRHPDDTVAAYAHLKKDKVFVAKGKWVPQGIIIAESDHTGHSDAPHLHFEVRAFRAGTDDPNQGPTIPVQFEDEKHMAWRPKTGDTFASNNTVFRQEGWRWCHKCQGLFYGGKPLSGTQGGACKAGGPHEAKGSGNYILTLNSEVAGQKGWRWCKNCQGLFFGDNPGSRCPIGGEHVKSISGNYVLLNDIIVAIIDDTTMGAQQGWRWCNKCQGLFFGDNPGSQCPASGSHSQTGSGNYVLVQNMTGAPGQEDWRWCNKCQGLFFGGKPNSRCPAGDQHSKTSSGNYSLLFPMDGVPF